MSSQSSRGPPALTPAPSEGARAADAFGRIDVDRGEAHLGGIGVDAPVDGFAGLVVVAALGLDGVALLQRHLFADRVIGLRGVEVEGLVEDDLIAVERAL